MPRARKARRRTGRASRLPADEDPLFVRVGDDPAVLHLDPEELFRPREGGEEHLLDLPPDRARTPGPGDPVRERVHLPRTRYENEGQPRLQEHEDPPFDAAA